MSRGRVAGKTRRAVDGGDTFALEVIIEAKCRRGRLAFKSVREPGGEDVISACSAERQMSSTMSNVSDELCEAKEGKCTKMSLISFSFSVFVDLGIACANGEKFSTSLFVGNIPEPSPERLPSPHSHPLQLEKHIPDTSQIENQ